MAPRLLVLLVVSTVTGCGVGQEPLEPGPQEDAGVQVDAGSGSHVDAAPLPDAGGQPDAGVRDAGTADAGATDTGAAADEGGDVEICDEVAVGASPVQPNVVLVVDKSGSMDEPARAGGARTKLQDTKDALNRLLDFGTGRIRFGWSSYPIGDQCLPGIVSVDCDSDSIDAIRTRIFLLGAVGGTPTGTTLENVLASRTLHDESRPNFVILLTDGVPTCPAGGGTTENQADNTRTLQAIQSLYASGIDTFVIGLGEDVNSSNPALLNQMADAGGRARPGGTRYYAANSLGELEQAFDQIGEVVIPCDLALGVEPEWPDYLWVYFDGLPLAKDPSHQDGWDYDANLNQIHFYGPACDALRAGLVGKVDVKMGCSPPYQ